MGKRGPQGEISNKAKPVKNGAERALRSFAPPDYLTPTAKKYWTEVVSAFPSGHFCDADKILLEQYCEAAAAHRNATDIVKREGRRYTDSKGVLRRNPAIDDQHQARCDCAMLATKLRITKTSMITPKTAGRAAIVGQSESNERADFGGLLFTGDSVEQ